MWIKMDPLEYACMKIRRFEKRFGLELGIDWVEYAPHSILNDYGGYYLDNITGERTIFIPRTRDKEVFDEFLFHEIGHYIYEKYMTLKLIDLFENILKLPTWKIIFYRMIGYLPAGFCSSYSLTSIEEDFCETLSLVLCNWGKRRNVDFDNSSLCLENDIFLYKKVEFIKNVLCELKQRASDF